MRIKVTRAAIWMVLRVSVAFTAIAMMPPPATAGICVKWCSRVPPDVARAALDAQKKWGVPASVMIAQWVIESAWGTVIPPGSNNPIGLLTNNSQSYVEFKKWEFVDGRRVRLRARFRRFESLNEAFNTLGETLATQRWYVEAMTHTSNPEAFAHALSEKYSTDPKYGAKLNYVIRAHNLDAYYQMRSH